MAEFSLESDNEAIKAAAALVADVVKAETDRETNLNGRGTTLAAVAGLIVTVGGAVAKDVFGAGESRMDKAASLAALTSSPSASCTQAGSSS